MSNFKNVYKFCNQNNFEQKNGKQKIILKIICLITKDISRSIDRTSQTNDI